MNKQEAKILLEETRNNIDLIDKELIELIDKRTKLAKNVIEAKKSLNMDIFDPSREEKIHEKIRVLTADKNIETNDVIKIIDILMNMNKDKQNEMS
ncbi:MAG: chorismate mutase [Methanobacteriaceae archaeon]|nr:chorismate mutase [Methanobacteriaceae archaeon]